MVIPILQVRKTEAEKEVAEVFPSYCSCEELRLGSELLWMKLHFTAGEFWG